MVQRIGDMCIGEAVSAYPFRHLNEFTHSQDPLSEPVAKAVMEHNHLGRLAPKAPCSSTTPSNDELIPFPSAQTAPGRLVRRRRARHPLRRRLSEHSSLAVSGSPLAVAYMGPRSPAPRPRHLPLTGRERRLRPRRVRSGR